MRKSIAVVMLLFAFPLVAQTTSMQRDLAAQLVTLIETPSVLDEVRDVLKPEAIQKVVAPVLIDIYSRSFTEGELAELIAFYSTPTGKKLAAQSRQLQRQIAEQTKKVIEPLIAEARQNATPWVGTIASMRAIGDALQQYSVDNAAYPETNFAGLEKVLVPRYLSEMPTEDAWGNSFYYIASGYGRHYRLASAGADGEFEQSSRQMTDQGDTFEEAELANDLNRDIVMANGSFLRIPRVAVPQDQ